ncbi:MAG: UDP-N-acetylmuramoyl-L-alanine--D-glutamate ligase [Betaproteobacteria bacterium]|nr:UDP-N-acetylmuramoyl-L-alanine--D-glutamate ligase [Betaproteobacteria bacterium]
MALREQTVLVLGLGDTGISVVRWLRGAGATVRVADSRQDPPHLRTLQKEFPDVRSDCGPFHESSFEGIDLIALSPGVPLAEPLVQDAVRRGIPVTGDVELFARALNKYFPRVRCIAITGSNGKSTVTSMVGAMCAKAGFNTVVAGNIGLPVLDALTKVLASNKTPDIFVLELSSFQLETTRHLYPDAATVLNVSEDHMDRYPGLAAYAAVKARIFNGEGVQVINRDDSMVDRMGESGRRVWTFSRHAPVSPSDFGLAEVDGELALAQGSRVLMRAAELRVTGVHNATNALAAIALCRALDLPEGPLLSALREFRGLAHRVERVAEIGGVVYYDDSKGTNVGATVAALNGFDCPVVLIAGGDGKGQDFTPLAAPVREHARAVVLIGRDAPALELALRGSAVPLERADSLPEAVRACAALAQPGDAVLLSPACASLDMFRNYAHRAEVFVDAVRRLPGVQA